MSIKKNIFAPWSKGLSATRRAATVLLLALLTAQTVWADGLSGSGTAADPYIIANSTDWTTFATAVSGGTTYEGKTVKLTADIDGITTMAGTSDNRFKGTFVGGGHTLTVNYTATANDCAPFLCIEGATINTLKVAGTISTGYKYAAGIAAHSYGNTTIQNCQSSVAITTSISGDGTHAGFVAVLESGSLSMTNCLFDGSITGESTNNCGGFVGWRNATLTFNNCLMSGTMGISQTDGSALFNRNGSSTLTNCYYDGSKSYGSIATQNATSTTVTGSDLQARLGSGWQVSGESVVPIMDAKNLGIATVSGLSGFYQYTGSAIAIDYTVTTFDGTPLTKGTHYTETFSPATVQEKGDYTLTITGKSPYSGSQTFTFTVGDGYKYIDSDGLEQSASPSDVALITTENKPTTLETGWYLVQGEVTISSRVTISGTVNLILEDGCTLKATSYIVTNGNTFNIYGQTAGTGALQTSQSNSNYSSYAGIGSYKNGATEYPSGTITINGGVITATGSGYSAAIGGPVTTEGYSGGGTITINGGIVNATGGWSAAAIGGGHNGDATVIINGGQVTATAYNASSHGIGSGNKDSSYKANLTSTISLGWKNASTDFIQASSYNGTVSFQEGKLFIIQDTQDPATTENIGGHKIVPAAATLNPNLAYATISGIQNYYTPNAGGIALNYQVSDLLGNLLTKGTDYTETFTNNSTSTTVTQITESGIYTLTITGTGSYSGSKTATITVTGYKETLGGYDFTVLADDDGFYYAIDGESSLRAFSSYSASDHCSGKRFVQTADIAMTGGNFTPIGRNNYFSGTYDGGNHIISGLTVSGDYQTAGLFSRVDGGTVKKVRLVNPSISSTYTGNLDAYFGALIGYMTVKATVSNCYIINPTISTTAGGTKYIGVIVGGSNDYEDKVTGCYYYYSSTENAPEPVGNKSYQWYPGYYSVTRVYKINANGCTATATPTISVDGTDYYTSGTAATVTAIVSSTGMKKFTATGTTASLTETLGQYTLTMPANDVTVSLADVTPTITVATGSTYTGSAQTPDITSVMDGETAMTAGTDYTNVAYSNNTNAGEANVSITGMGFYLGTASQTFAIAPASVTLTANSRNTDTYDGTEKTVTGYTSSVDGLTFAESVSASGSGTNAGEYDVTFSGVTLNETKDNTGNYVITATTNGKLTINTASVTLTANSETKAYSGAEQTVTGFTCNVEGLTFTGINASGSGTNTGSYPVTFTGVTIGETKDNTGNYMVNETVSGTLTIEAAITNFGAAKITWNENGTTVEFDGSSEESIAIKSDIEVNAVTYTRTFTADKASTVMLPFDYTCNGNEGGKFYEFVGVTYDNENSKWVATMQEPGNTSVTSLTANTPYLFMPNGTTMTFPNISNMEGGKVTLNTTKTGGSGVGSSASGKWQFHGTYAKKVWDAASNDYGFAATSGTAAGGTAAIEAGQFVRFTTNAFIKPMRCYLSYIGTSALAPARGLTRSAAEELPQSITVRLLSRSGETTGIGTLDTQTGEFDFDGWYDMNGRKLSGKPTKKGLYINNGKKIVIK